MKLPIFAALITFAATMLQPLSAARTPSIAPEFINFGYVQNSTILPYVQLETFTHVAAPFVNFTGSGALSSSSVNGFNNRHSSLRLGGAADRAGTKVIMCVRNDGFNETILKDVMQSSSRRTLLVNSIRDLVNQDTYCAGVNFDFEFSWTTATRDGITAFLQEMRAALPGKELSVYTHAYYSASKWDIPGIIDNVDYLLYSTYDFGTSKAHAIADYDDVIVELTKYLNAGVPPDKLVLTWVTYGRRFYSPANEKPVGYNIGGSEDNGYYNQSQGFYDAMFDTTLRKANGGSFTPTYRRGDETITYSYTQPDTTGTQINFFAVGETPETLELKISAARSFPGASPYSGVRLRGVGWWSMMWVSKYWTDYRFKTPNNKTPPVGGAFSAFDPITNSVASRAPYYRHVDLLVQELLKKPGQTRFQLESFEGDNPHWRDPNESPDTKGDAAKTSTFTFVSAPAGAGRPPDTVRGGRLGFNFQSASGNKAFLRYEMMNNSTETTVKDSLAALALVSRNTRFSGYYHVAANYPNRSLRFALVDGLGQVEVSKPISLTSKAGWNQFTWGINDPAQIDPYVTAEPALLSGNGSVDSGSPDARDISFLGFIVEGGGSGSGAITFDELTYESRAPEGKQYIVNEFRHRDPKTEFVEIAGPPGPFPAGMKLISYKSIDAAIFKETSLAGQSIPPSGIFVVGDAGVPGATSPTGFKPANWSTGADLPKSMFGSLQLYDSTTGFVYDSAVYGAFGGIAELARVQTRRVTAEGYGWIGSTGNGIDDAGQQYSLGRRPGPEADTDHNQRDFYFMPATPGVANTPPALIGEDPWNFSVLPPGSFQTFQNMKLQNPTASGIPASPSGGQVYRCVDTSGGGTMGIFGDADMGGTRGVEVTGEIYIPATAHPAQAVAVGFCGTQGSSFFESYPLFSGYEDGYWLIYENGLVNLEDGQPNHAGSFQFIHATNDNLDLVPSTALGSLRTPAQLGTAAGTWTTFMLRIDPTAAADQRLVAQINGADIYRGPIPENGPATGAFMVGHREAGGGVAATEGTWIDNLSIQYATPPARVSNYELY